MLGRGSSSGTLNILGVSALGFVVLTGAFALLCCAVGSDGLFWLAIEASWFSNKSISGSCCSCAVLSLLSTCLVSSVLVSMFFSESLLVGDFFFGLRVYDLCFVCLYFGINRFLVVSVLNIEDCFIHSYIVSYFREFVAFFD